jgi:hypothetical protein
MELMLCASVSWSPSWISPILYLKHKCTSNTDYGHFIVSLNYFVFSCLAVSFSVVISFDFFFSLLFVYLFLVFL